MQDLMLSAASIVIYLFWVAVPFVFAAWIIWKVWRWIHSIRKKDNA